MKRKSLTLIEILVAVILIAISLAALASAIVAGKYFLKKSENDAQALSIALALKEDLLSRAYNHPDLDPSLSPKTDTEDTIFDWRTSVIEKSLCDPTGRCIPYKEIEVIVQYPDETITGSAATTTKRVVIKDIIPFPKVHLHSVDTGGSPCTSAVAACEVSTIWKPVGDPASSLVLHIDLPDYKVDKDLLVIYDIAINIENAAGLLGPDSILTRATIDGVATTPETQTPIISQGSISNILRIGDVAKNLPHVVKVEWSKNTGAGTISIEKSSLVVIAVETQ